MGKAIDSRKIVSANSVIYGTIENGRAIYRKWRGNQMAEGYSVKESDAMRMAGFGNVGISVMSRDIAKSLEVDITMAKGIAVEIIHGFEIQSKN